MNHPAPLRVAIVGAGAMGSGIAQIAAQSGHPVSLFDERPEAVLRAIASIRQLFDKLAAKGKITPEAASAASARLSPAASLADLSSAGVLVEAIVEQLEPKQRLFAAVEALVSPGCLLATNTSSLSVTAIAAALRAPHRLVGMHFFNPAPLMELVEIVSGAATAPAVAAQAHALAAAWGKSPVYAASTPGFIVNRVARPFYAEALRLIQEQAASPATLDAVLREAGGFRMGPCELMDLIGHDVNFAVTQGVFDGFFGDPRFRPSIVQQELVRAGFLGRKSGRGFFSYAPGAAPPLPDTAAPAPPPREAVIGGADAQLEAIAARLESAHVRVTRVPADQSWIETGDAVLALTDGRTAEQRAEESGPRNLVLLDHALDFAAAKRVAVTRPARCRDNAFQQAVGLLQAAGLAVSPIADVPAMIVLRTVAMLANEAADAVNQGVATAADVDTAMRKGVNYPRGPLAWADALGIQPLHAALRHLQSAYGEDRYRMSPLIRRLHWSRGRFHG